MTVVRNLLASWTGDDRRGEGGVLPSGNAT